MTDPGPLRNLNLNLMSHLDALLTFRSVSKAADHLGLSQPTVSSALQRLRRHFKDELIVRDGPRPELTPLAAELLPLATAALGAAERLFTSTTIFDPRTSTREFRLVGGDYWVASVGAAFAASVAASGSRVRIRFGKLGSGQAGRILDVLRTVDGILAPHGDFRDLPHVDLCSAEWVCLVDSANARVGDELTRADLASLPWVAVTGDSGPNAPLWEPLALRRLRQAGIEPNIAVVVDSYLAVPWFVEGTDRIAIVHKGMLERFGERRRLRVMRCPVDLDPLLLALWWHPQFGEDGGHRWLRTELRSVAEGLPV
ncbi:LysR family transcriptional regulator [Amycolatopsis sp. GM8]|uniref:LysR family transcriptional regulator n=1 Tax=Amycolatopsis sp. GM8 TaxID=2896530 RepID=UPI001F26D75B|nr:LysR family transcriptional regulator [Amycolatopsis sp. GM8]